MKIRLNIFAAIFLVFAISLIFMQSVSSSHLLPTGSIQRTYACNPQTQCIEQDHGSIFYCTDFGSGYRWYDIKDIFSGSIEDIKSGKATCNLNNFNTCSTFNIAQACGGVVDPLNQGGHTFSSSRLSGFCNPQTNKWNFYDQANFDNLCKPAVASFKPCNQNSECVVEKNNKVFYCTNFNNAGFKWYETNDFWQGNMQAGTAVCKLNNFYACSTFTFANACSNVVDPTNPRGYAFKSGRLSGFCNPQTNKWNFYDEASFENLCLAETTTSALEIPAVTSLQSCNPSSQCVVKQGNDVFYCSNFNNAGFKWYKLNDIWTGDVSAGTATCNLQKFNTCSTFTFANACSNVVDPNNPRGYAFKSGRLSGFCNPQTNKWNFYDEASFNNLCQVQIPPTQSTSVSEKKDVRRFSVSSLFALDLGNYINVYTKIKNTGNKKSDIKIKISIPELGIYDANNIDLGSKQAKWSVFSFDMPQGKYVVKLEVSNGKGSQIKYLEVEN